MTVRKLRTFLPTFVLIANPDDDISLRRVINVPKRGIGSSSVDKMANFALNYDVSMNQALDSVELMGLSPKITKAQLNLET